MAVVAVDDQSADLGLSTAGRAARTVLHDVPGTADDPRLGLPICPDCFDYSGAVLWNAHAPGLWRRFMLVFRRYIARSAGQRVAELREVLTVDGPGNLGG